ncbi:MAG: hypothetical protein CL944_01320, partial [Candidatus Diapherotrites archaeon]|nr:hypothetical protein [Candidatus Diapherotrites archaeon]
KGRNFVEAMFTLKGRNNFFRKKNSVIVNIDADALNLEEKIITGIAKEITKKDVPMLLGRHIERGVDVRVFGGIASPSATGFRVMKAKALEPLFSMSKAWLRTFPRKFGMDHALNILIYRKTIVKGTKIDTSKIPVSGYELFHEKPGKHESDAVQVRQRADVRQRFFGNRKVQFSRPEELAFHERKGKAPKQHQRKIK